MPFQQLMRQRSNFVTVLLILLLCSLGFGKTELDRRGRKTKVKSVENFEVAYWGPDSDRRHGTRNLRGLSLYNRSGDLIVQWSLTNDSNGSYYEKHLYSYDRFHRKQTASIFRSSRTARDQFFSSARTTGDHVIVLPVLAETLTAQTRFEYDVNGRLVCETSHDRTGRLIDRRILEYDSAGNNIRFAIVRAGGSFEMEALTVHHDQGRKVETTYIRPGNDLQRTIRYIDIRGRTTSEELFVLKQISPALIKFTLTSRLSYTYVDNAVSNAEWRFFKPDGEPHSKIIMVHHAGMEISRDEYSAGQLPPGSQNENIEPVWQLGRSTIRQREFEHGNLVMDIWRERSSPSDEFKNVYEFVNVLTYY